MKSLNRFYDISLRTCSVLKRLRFIDTHALLRVVGQLWCFKTDARQGLVCIYLDGRTVHSSFISPVQSLLYIYHAAALSVRYPTLIAARGASVNLKWKLNSYGGFRRRSEHR